MSRETVYALRRFTEKMAAGMANYTMGPDVRPNMGPIAGVPGAGSVPATKPDSRQNLLSPDSPVNTTAPSAATMQAPGLPELSGMSDGPVSAGVNELSADRLNRSYAQKAMERDPVMMTQLLQTLGGAGVGGLGAYGLARLLQSREDREKQRFPWLSTLAGTAAGGVLLPMLMQNQSVQSGLASAGSAIGNAASSLGGAVSGLMPGQKA